MFAAVYVAMSPQSGDLSMKMKTRILFSFALALLVSIVRADQPPSLFERLAAGNDVRLTISTDVSALIANKNTDEYQSALLLASDGKKYEASVKPRGKFRRRIAEIPPLKIKIKKKLLLAEGLDTLNELKLVLPTSLDEAGDERVVREYFAYKMYERVSPYHVRAQLITLTLQNTGLEGEAQYTVKAILLEDEEETAARLGGTVIERYGMTMSEFETEQAALMAVFQYMIGNTDWSLSDFRNVRLLQTNSGAIVPIPFDFDFCGFVDAPYATPMSESGLRNVRDRFLMADGLAEDAIKKAAKTLQDQRPAFAELLRAGHVSEKVAEKCLKYLDSFFKEKM